MNWYKRREIIEFIRSQGGLPVDGTGRALSPDEVLVWFGFDKLLTEREQEEVKQEIREMAEARAVSEWLRLGVRA